MELSVNGRRSVDSAPIATKLGAKGRGKCQLSFALLFRSIRAFFCENNYLRFSFQFLAGHMERPLIGCCTPNSASMLTKLGSKDRGKF
jgi:hypothetical protein